LNRAAGVGTNDFYGVAPFVLMGYAGRARASDRANSLEDGRKALSSGLPDAMASASRRRALCQRRAWADNRHLFDLLHIVADR